ncbi:hypothetical protein B0H11DRAFT_2351019 [Mycena galericulata]|nr:hypothetical protein B0H11DRAFT_2351019 [Mycena galericulata]
MAVVDLYRALQESLAGHELETMRHAAFQSLKEIDLEEVDRMVLYVHALSMNESIRPAGSPVLTENGRKAAYHNDMGRKKRFLDIVNFRRGAERPKAGRKGKTVTIGVFIGQNDLVPTKRESYSKFSHSSRDSLDSLLWRLNKKLIKEKALGIIYQNPHFYRLDDLDQLRSSISNSPSYLKPLGFRQSFNSDVELAVYFDGYWQIWLDTAAPRRFGNVWKVRERFILKDALGGLCDAQQVEGLVLGQRMEIFRANGDLEKSLDTWTALLVAWHKNRANTRHAQFSVKLKPAASHDTLPSVQPTNVVARHQNSHVTSATQSIFTQASQHIENSAQSRTTKKDTSSPETKMSSEANTTAKLSLDPKTVNAAAPGLGRNEPSVPLLFSQAVPPGIGTCTRQEAAKDVGVRQRAAGTGPRDNGAASGHTTAVGHSEITGVNRPAAATRGEAQTSRGPKLEKPSAKPVGDPGLERKSPWAVPPQASESNQGTERLKVQTKPAPEAAPAWGGWVKWAKTRLRME